MRPIVAAALALGLTLAACSSSDDPLAEGSAGGGALGAGERTSAATGGRLGASDLPAPTSPAYFRAVIGDRVFFGTDSASLDADAQGTLAEQAEWLIANPDATATIQGHADERGTREYNLALGARRASAVRAFLVAQGVQGSRLDTVSFGKERPVATCSNESCWSQNRRGVTVLAGGPVS